MRRILAPDGWRTFDSLVLVLMTAVLALGVYEHYSARSENRRAIIKLAHAQCAANDIFENSALKNAKSDAQIERIRAFFNDFDRPINAALATLGAEPCTDSGAPKAKGPQGPTGPAKTPKP